MQARRPSWPDQRTSSKTRQLVPEVFNPLLARFQRDFRLRVESLPMSKGHPVRPRGLILSR